MSTAGPGLSCQASSCCHLASSQISGEHRAAGWMIANHRGWQWHESLFCSTRAVTRVYQHPHKQPPSYSMIPMRQRQLDGIGNVPTADIQEASAAPALTRVVHRCVLLHCRKARIILIIGVLGTMFCGAYGVYISAQKGFAEAKYANVWPQKGADLLFQPFFNGAAVLFSIL